MPVKHWYVWFDATKGQYQLEPADTVNVNIMVNNRIAMFKNFDMAYDYVTKANKMTDVMSYSRWAR